MNTVSHDSETPAHGQQVITACAFIHHNFGGVEKAFFPKRAITKKFLPDVYELPGGHINYGEDIAVGLAREVREEFGMDVSIGDPFVSFTYTNEVKGSHSIEVIYFARFTSPIDEVTLNPQDHSGFEWIAENEMNKIYSDQKGPDDPEMRGVQKGFSLLRGEKPTF